MKFIKTCNWCPEQYDIFDEEKQVAYMRVKYGICECYVPDADGTIFYHEAQKKMPCFQK